MKALAKPKHRNLVNLVIDFIIFLAFLITMAPRFSGIAIHEWLSIAFGAAIIAHLLLHWSWIVNVTKRLFAKTQWSARINYLINVLFFIAMTLVIFTGIMISKEALPLFGIRFTGGGTWRELHDITANLSLILLGVHVALHWQWIVSMTKKYILRRKPRRAVLQTNEVSQ